MNRLLKSQKQDQGFPQWWYLASSAIKSTSANVTINNNISVTYSIRFIQLRGKLALTLHLKAKATYLDVLYVTLQKDN